MKKLNNKKIIKLFIHNQMNKKNKKNKNNKN